MRSILVRAAVASALLVGIAPARAQSSAESKREWPTEITKRPLTLATGMLEAWVPLQLNASTGADWRPVSVNPSLAFGLTDQWTIGLRSIFGLCLGGAANGCPQVYNDVGAYSRISLGRGGGIEIAVQGGVDWVHLTDPKNWAAWAGAVLRGGRGVVAVALAPSVSFGLSDRNGIQSRYQPIAWNMGSYDVVTSEQTFDNREHLSVPLTVQVQLAPTIAVAAGASLEGPIDPKNGSFSDLYRIPLGLAAVVTPAWYLDVGASFTWPQFGGKNDNRDVRALAVFVAFRS
jgi:hypothetical protein